MNEETPPYEPTGDQAFRDARAGFQLGDIELFPHSTQRRFAADRMGLTWGSIPRDDPLLRSGRYSGALRDVVIVLWLGTIPRKAELTSEQRSANAWTVERADRMPDDAYAVAQEWAESVGITDTDTGQFRKAWDVFVRIKMGESVSSFRVTTDSVSPVPPESEAGNVSGPQDGPHSSQESPALPGIP